MGVFLYEHQKEAVRKIHNGCILVGDVGSGKSMTSLAYYFTRILGGMIGENGALRKPKRNVPLYIITTAMKRDKKDWDGELTRFCMCQDGGDCDIFGLSVKVDSWNNIGKYVGVRDSFFIFDEQRVIGSGAWVKSFLKISRSNLWILLSATPGDSWLDYIPVFIANGFYKNRTQFLMRHAVFNQYSKYPKIDRFIEEEWLEKLRSKVLVKMVYLRETVRINKYLYCEYDEDIYNRAFKDRWNLYRNEPIQESGALCYILRKIVNSDPSRLRAIDRIREKHKRIIIFYNGDYELEILRKYAEDCGIIYAEWNGHKHEPIPDELEWFYLVQYTAGCEGWNCIETNAVIFYSQNYSYKVMEQASGRIDRMNTPYDELYYYHLLSKSSIDAAIRRALQTKKDFNEKSFLGL